MQRMGALMGFVLLWLICGIVTAIIAANKGRSGIGWLIIGFILGIFGIILIACMPSLKPQTVTLISADTSPTLVAASKKCPDCAEIILVDAKVCKHCGFRFSPVAEKTNV
ncbi:MAG: hypothetical protein DI589_05930 [Shinella sp.]|nr:MAG: hypothetical protein DI589_05930 [Shinella sp.]